MSKIFLMLLFIPALIFAQQKFNVDFNYAHFYSGEEYSTVEFYYSFSKNSMNPIKSGDEQKVYGRLEIIILDSTETEELVNKDWTFESALDPTESASEQKLTGLIRYYLSPGKYYCTLKGFDAVDSLSFDSVAFDLNIPEFVNNSILVSDIQLANSIVQNSGNVNSPFYKNTLEVIPNPSSLYGHGLPVFFFYYEIYNADVNKKTDYLTVNYELFNSEGKSVYSKRKFISRANNSLVDIGAIKINQMITGQYNFVVSVEDTVSRAQASTSNKIFIYNPDLLDTNNTIIGETDFLASKYLTMSLEELDREFDMSRYLTTASDKETWKKLVSAEAKRKYLFDFWNSRDKDPSTSINETQIEYLSRVDFSNRNYSDLSHKEGWKSDRGRVYILFGAPSEVERFPYDVERIPYEIWHYENIEGGVVFVFADYTGYSSYKLLHSTKRGELQDSNWESKVSK